MPRKQFDSKPTPSWLQNLNTESKFNRRDVLNSSIYYPGSYVDGSPLQAYGGYAHSFVYVDYYCDKETIIRNLPKIGGYEPLFIKDVTTEELSPVPKFEVELKNTDFYGSCSEQSISELLNNSISNSNPREKPFCIWSVLQRKSTVNPSHGPERFSMLSIFGEGVATYASIFNSNLLCPIAIIINAADIGFGRNWTLFEKKGGIFERVVMSNPIGIPKFLFTWDRYDPTGQNGWNMYRDTEMYWEKYTKKVQNRNYLNIWTTDNFTN